MDAILEIWAWISAHQVVLLGAALAVSEVLALIPSVKSNSIFQLAIAGLKKLAGKK